jgi:Na+-translocating ferredoxin:NAD+ oxidoreductase RnfG subunit
MSTVIRPVFRQEQHVAAMLRELAEQAERGEIRSAVVMAETADAWAFRSVVHEETEGAEVLGVVHVLAHQMAAMLAE